MRKSLKERLNDAKNTLTQIDSSLNSHSSKIKPEVDKQFRKVTALINDIDPLIDIINTRSVSLKLLADLENDADSDDNVPFGTTRVKYQYARLIGVQAYLATHWALIDRLTGMIGQIICTQSAIISKSAKLVPQFLKDDRKKEIPILFFTLFEKRMDGLLEFLMLYAIILSMRVANLKE